MISQNGVKKEIEKEMDRSGSQPGVDQASKPNCERCGKPEHNLRMSERDI
jgi:hypothetical protein